VSIYDLDPTINVCKNLIRSLDKLAQPDKLPWNLLLFMDSAYISRIPYGVVLILGKISYTDIEGFRKRMAFNFGGLQERGIFRLQFVSFRSWV